ncbi:MAG: ATP-binding protein [Candidatus Omnitrophota bacterium]|nr:ATP-binding protein [Candidatus Omnitrophota bacterium]
MPDNPFIINLLGAIGAVVITILSAIVFLEIERIRQLRFEVKGLNKSLEEMDEQARLIIRTDMELNKTQEELDKKITGLYALQKLVRAISMTLEEPQIFKKINTACLKDIGFEKAIGFLYNEKEIKFISYLNIGYTVDEVNAITPFVESNKDFYINLIKTKETFSSLSDIKEFSTKEMINRLFKVSAFIISPFLPQEGNKGFLFVGTEEKDVLINQGDEELIVILASQLSRSLENARLFEKTWGAQQELEKKVLERTQELAQTIEEVKKISRRKTDFVSSVSHELRTPLTSIKGYAAILLAGKLGEVPLAVWERLEKINRHSDELVHMVNDMLDISRIESGREIMKFETQDLKILVEKVADLLLVQLKDKQIELNVDISDNTKEVFVDVNQIERVFINIVGNAIKFTPSGGKIFIFAFKLNRQIQVDITDTGSGIPEEALEAIFEEFYRVDNPINQQVKGTGLGLALVKHIVEAHSGKIWAKSKVGFGSTFSFTLPGYEEREGVILNGNMTKFK